MVEAADAAGPMGDAFAALLAALRLPFSCVTFPSNMSQTPIGSLWPGGVFDPAPIAEEKEILSQNVASIVHQLMPAESQQSINNSTSDTHTHTHTVVNKCNTEL